MKLKVISQEKILLEKDNVSVLTLPTLNGQIQILEDHENFVSVLDLGEAMIESTDGKEKEILIIAGGVVQVEDNEVVLLSDQADLASDLVAEEIDKAIELAQEKRSSSETTPSELIRLEKQLMYERFKKKYA